MRPASPPALVVVVGRSDVGRQQMGRNIDRQVDLAAIGVTRADIAGPHPAGGLPSLSPLDRQGTQIVSHAYCGKVPET